MAVFILGMLCGALATVAIIILFLMLAMGEFRFKP